MKYILYSIILLLFASCNNKEKEKPLTYQDYQYHAANMIAQPDFTGDSLLYKMIGAEANLEMFYMDTKKIIFSCDKNKLNEVLSKLAINKDSIISKQPNETKSQSDTKIFFEMNVINLKIDTSKVIETKYNNATYHITIPQMVDFVTMKSNLRGGAFAVTPNGQTMISHGVAVAIKGEPSLSDLVNQLTDKTKSVEVNAQNLLDFVTNEIEYSNAEATSGGETIKRPDEILFTRNSDCSGKTILYASLLQQLNCKWCILYYDKHVCVGIAGNFKTKNTSKISIDGIDYYIAETTAPNAIIGEDYWKGKLSADYLEFYQIPANSADIIDYQTKKPLEFLKMKVKN
ncbi:MAG: transglutaminase domain-containing protein [Chitinophagales bacterium]|nr:transglutaminase domain-containing protein [Chitinophagales bacterium]